MKSFTDFIRKYQNRPIAIAVSGGADSMALMHIAAKSGLDAVALTVDHGLRPDSEHEAILVATSAKKLGISHHTLKWVGKKPKTGIEAAAREARYDLMLSWCRANNIDTLLLAHQADDQIETFLLNLGRGSGVYGLGAMRTEQSRSGIIIARPLLNVSRAELSEYCRTHKIKYVHDKMNDDENFLRVKIRKNRHLLRDKLDISDERILTAIESLGRVRDVIEADIGKLVKSILIDSRAIFGASFLFDMPEEIRLKFLSRLFQIIGELDYPPRLEKVRHADYILQSDCKFTTAHCIVRRLGTKILVAPEGSSTSFRK
ncbi:MAG: tRNA lysidine(34) synthetase TilS [Alphaproteobacteria bacterium]|nr:tRNA lysidine(34) synthetase TilS [Alphaproteobacteria bacterium]